LISMNEIPRWSLVSLLHALVVICHDERNPTAAGKKSTQYHGVGPQTVPGRREPARPLVMYYSDTPPIVSLTTLVGDMSPPGYLQA
jgi:hypothetical protein